MLYKYAVSWDHNLREWIDDSNDGNSDYVRGFEKRMLNDNMEHEHVKAFILHNMGIFFIVHLAIFLFYIIVKIWDCIKSSLNKSYMYTILVFMEFTVLIVGYLLVHMQAFTFSFINIRKAYFKHHYFVFCFLIALCYLIVFIAFWMYSFFKIMVDDQFFMDPLNYNKFYYFLVGYKETKYCRTYDHWVTLFHFFVAMMIGLLMFEPLAQIIIILILLILLLAVTILLRPWLNLFYNIFDILS